MKQPPLSGLPADVIPDKVGGIRIGPNVYLVARRKGNKYPSLFRWNIEDKKATVIARFTSEEEAKEFWDVIGVLAAELESLLLLTSRHIDEFREWGEVSALKSVRSERDERSE